jgi:hypothetical protein
MSDLAKATIELFKLENELFKAQNKLFEKIIIGEYLLAAAVFKQKRELQRLKRAINHKLRKLEEKKE